MKKVGIGSLLILVLIIGAAPISGTIFDEYQQLDYFRYDLDFFEEFEDQPNRADGQFRDYTYLGNFNGTLGFNLHIHDYNASYEQPYDLNHSNYRVDPETGYVHDSDNNPIVTNGQVARSILYVPNTMNMEIGDDLMHNWNYTIVNITEEVHFGETLEVIKVENSHSNSTQNFTVSATIDRQLGFFIDLRMENEQSWYYDDDGNVVEKDYYSITSWVLTDYHRQKIHGELTYTHQTQEEQTTWNEETSEDPFNVIGEYPLPIPTLAILSSLIALPIFRKLNNP